MKKPVEAILSTGFYCLDFATLLFCFPLHVVAVDGLELLLHRNGVPAALLGEFLLLLGLGEIAQFPLRVIAEHIEGHGAVLVILQVEFQHAAVTHAVAESQHRALAYLGEDAENLVAVAVLTQEHIKLKTTRGNMISKKGAEGRFSPVR